MVGGRSSQLPTDAEARPKVGEGTPPQHKTIVRGFDRFPCRRRQRRAGARQDSMHIRRRPQAGRTPARARNRMQLLRILTKTPMLPEPHHPVRPVPKLPQVEAVRDKSLNNLELPQLSPTQPTRKGEATRRRLMISTSSSPKAFESSRAVGAKCRLTPRPWLCQTSSKR